MPALHKRPSRLRVKLEVSNYGILCLTPESLSAPWLNFKGGLFRNSSEKVASLLY
jgi:hypothetical protein